VGAVPGNPGRRIRARDDRAHKRGARQRRQPDHDAEGSACGTERRQRLAFTQSMVSALESLKTSYNLKISISDNEYVVSDAANLIRQYAASGYNLVIAHGSQYGSTLQALAPKFPKVSFAWGTAGSTFNEPNIYAYQADSNEGGYVQGYMAGMLSKSHVIGVIGPINVGDASCTSTASRPACWPRTPRRRSTCRSPGPSATSRSWPARPRPTCRRADVLTGSSQSVVGAIGIAKADKVAWFGTQWTQASLAPSEVVSPRSTTGSRCSRTSLPGSGRASSVGRPTRSPWPTTARRSCSTRPTRCPPT